MAAHKLELTAARSEEIQRVYCEYRDVGLSTESADFEAAQTAIMRLYERVGRKRPYFVQLDSPLAAELYIDLYCRTFPTVQKLSKDKLGGQLRDQLRDQLWDQLGDQLWDQLRGQLRGQLGDQLRDQLRGQLGDQLRGQLGDQLGDQLRGQLGDQLWDQLRDQLWDQLRGQLWDQLWDQLRDQLRGQLRDQLRGQLGGQLRDQLRDQLWGQLGGQLRGQLGDQLRDQLRGQLGDQLRGQLGGQLRDQLRDQLWDQLRDQLWDQLWDQLGDQLWDQLRDQLRGQLRGQSLRYMGTWFSGAWDSYLWGWFDGGRRVGAVYPPVLDALLDDHITVSRSIGWWYPFDEFCVLTAHPDAIRLDDRERLHSTAGPALHYRDGYALHAVHGVRVPAWIIERKEEITIPKIDAETNAEIRRVMVEQYGQDKYLLDSGATLVQRDQVGLLYRKELPGDEPIVMVRVLNSTPEPDGVMSREEAIEAFGGAARAAIDAPEGSRFKQYMLRVPPTVRTAHEAVAWTFGLEAETYHPALES